MKLALGVPEVLEAGGDITIVSYGSTLRIVQEAINIVKPLGISCELIDVQTLLPFDIHHDILKSLKKTNRILFVDEDVRWRNSLYVQQGDGRTGWLSLFRCSAKNHNRQGTQTCLWYRWRLFQQAEC